MKAALYVLAFLLIGAGLGAGMASLMSPGQVIHGIDAGLAGTLLAGGFMVLGLATLATSIDSLTQTLAMTLKLEEPRTPLVAEVAPPAMGEELARENEPVAPETQVEPVPELPAAEPFFVPAPEEAEAPVPVATAEERQVAVEEVVEPVPAPGDDKVEAFGETGVQDQPAPEPAVVEEELYVVEEREFRGRPARILSDGTVEAETDEGWMRFENMEHLEEYLDAMTAMASGRA